MTDTLLLTINNHPLSLSESLAYLRVAGKLQPFLMEIVQQYVLKQETSAIADIDIDTVEQYIIDFRLQQQLAKPEQFAQWLTANGMNFADFRASVAFRLKVDQLKAQVAEPKLEEYFAQNQRLLEQVVFSRIVVDNSNLAQDLRQQVEQQGADFNQLAKLHSVVDDAVVGGVMGAISREEMPDFIQAATLNVTPGQIIGPFEIDDLYCLLKVEEVVSATLEGELKQELENQIFEEWLQEKLQQMNVQLAIE